MSSRLHSSIGRLVLLVSLLAICNGCGYQLRGSASLPQVMAVTYIEGLSPYSALVDDFGRALRTRNIVLASNPKEATATIRITGNDIYKLVLSVDSVGNVLEFEIRQTVRFVVSSPQRQGLLDEQSLTLSRDFLFTSTDVLAKAREENIVRRTLQKNIVELAMLRIASIDRN